MTEAESVVQRQLDAFNSRDIDALLATYANDALLFEHPAKLLASGATELRQRFVSRFQEPNLRAVLLNRIVAGSVVVDHEKVTRTFPEGAGEIELVMIYEVKAGRIATACTIVGTKTDISCTIKWLGETVSSSKPQDLAAEKGLRLSRGSRELCTIRPVVSK